MKPTFYLAASLALLSTGLLTGCGNDDDAPIETAQEEAPQSPAEHLLRYIPADSPYYVSTREALPEEDVFTLYQRMPMDNLESDLDELRQSLPEIDDPGLRAIVQVLLAVGEELMGVETLEDVHALGLKMSPHSALYGLGILPVLRFELENEDSFRTTLERVLERAEIQPRTATTDGTEYWILSSGEGPLQAIMTIIDGQALLSVVPSDASDTLLAEVMGKTLPDENIDDSGALEALEERHAFTPAGAGRVDTARLFAELSDPQHAGTTALLDATDTQPLDLSSCQGDIDRLTGRFPGLVMGMREYSLERMEVNLILQTDEEIVGDLRDMIAPVPGMGATNGIASAGLGLDLPMLLQTVQRYGQAVRENPFTCEELRDLNGTWDELNMALNNPITLMLGSSLSGLNARIDSLYMKAGAPTLTGVLTLASQNPMGLISTASAFLPELGMLGLEPGGETKRVESMLLPPEVPPLYAAMSDSALVLSSGEDTKAPQAALDAEASDRDLLFYSHFTGDFYTALADVLDQTPNEEMTASDIEMLRQYGDVYRLMEYWVRVDDAGVEMGLSMELEDE